MTTSSNFIKLKQLPRAEQYSLLALHRVHSDKLFGVAPIVKQDYTLYIQKGDVDESSSPVSTLTDISEYLESANIKVTVEELVNSLNILDYVEYDGVKKNNIDGHTVFTLHNDWVKKIRDSGSAIEKSTFLLGVSNSLEFYVKLGKTISIFEEDMQVETSEYDMRAELAIRDFLDIYPSQIAQEDYFKTLCRDVEELHPCLYGALKFFTSKIRLPRKEGHDRTDELTMWRFITKKYGKSYQPNTVNYLGRSYSLDGMWKHYQETYNEIVLKALSLYTPKA